MGERVAFRLNASIVRQLTVVNTLVSGFALLLGGAAFGAYDRVTFAETLLRHLSTEARIAASNSVSALVFNDPSAANDTLSALRAAPNIISATITTLDGRRFAEYRRDHVDPPTGPPPLMFPAASAEVYHVDKEQITLALEIVFDGRQVGRVELRSDLRELAARRQQYVGIVMVVFLASLSVALLLSWLSQRAISAPIVHLAETAKKVSSERDYSVRAPVTKQTNELAVLTEAFNDMLAQIQRQDTSLHETAGVLEERVAELDAVNKELEAFSYSVSHDLRAPLRHVSGFATLLEERTEGQLDPKSRKYLQTITDAAAKMGQLIDDLLEFSRIGRGPLHTQRVCLGDLVREARQEVTADPAIAARNIEWRVHDLPEVEGDAATLRLAIINLLSNAVKYTSTRAEAQIEVGAGDGRDEVVVFVRDNGVGFDMQYVHKLFGVFQRLHSSDEFEGTGIGLANVKRIIQRHGGRVWAEGELNRGATFYFALPTKRRSI
jgi:signal transduction histidine kinase